MRSVVVANPGHTPWFSHAAVALDESELLRSYVSPIQLGPRSAPNALDAMRLEKAASPSEIAAIALSRLKAPQRIRREAADRRDRRFDRAVAKRLRSTDSAVLLTYGAALSTIRRAGELGVGSVVEQPVQHHSFITEILNEEIGLQPKWAPTMQFHEPSARRTRRHDEELEEADRIVVFSDFSRRTFLDAGVPSSKLVVNQLGSDITRLETVVRRPDDVFRVLFLGVLSQRKGLSYLVDGFSKAAIPGSELLLVGTPWNGVTPWEGVSGVRHISWLAPSDVPNAFAQADVLVLPSLVEGLARVLIEAMAAGVPVIATPNSGAEELVRNGENGWIVPIRDPDAIAEHLNTLCNEPDLLDAMRADARQTSASFTWDAYGERCVHLVNNLEPTGP